MTYPNADVQSYTFDAQGNRLTKVQNAATTNYSYDDADQMTAAGGVTYTYDDNGNQTAAGSDTFTWDAENRLTGTTIGGTTGTYTFNGAGLRMSRTIGGVTSAFVWDQNGGLPQILKDSSGNRFVYGLDLISRTDSGGTQEYYLTDGLGSTTGLATGMGTVTDTYTYDVYGAVRTRTGTSGNEFTFTGEQTDASGLQYLRARSYNPATGRFVGLDPLPLMQRYAYVGGNPVNLVDPTGLCGELNTSFFSGCKDAAKDVAGDAQDVAGDAVGVVNDAVGATAGVAFENYCSLAPSGSCLVWRALDRIATKGACASPLSDSYFDLNLFAGGVGPTVGVQLSCKEGLHPYASIAVGTTNVSFTAAPNQNISEGGACSMGGAAMNFGGQLGVGGVIQLDSGGFGSAPSTFREVGPGSTGGNASCIVVLGRP